MGWWEQNSSRWELAIVAQVGGAATIGAGGFFLQLRSPDLPVKPNFLAVAAGLGVGGSIGSGISLPCSTLIRQLINPKAVVDTSGVGYSALEGDFSCRDIQLAGFAIAQAQVADFFVGAQLVYVTAHARGGSGDSTPVRRLFSTRIDIPKTLPTIAGAVFDLPQIQGGLGAGAFAFDGVMFYVGA